MGSPKAAPYPAMARFKFGDGRLGEVRHAADIEVGIARRRGALAAFVLGTGLPALLRNGALEALGGQLDCKREILTIRTHGVDIRLTVNEVEHYVLSVVASGRGPSCVDRGPNLAASYF